MFSRGARLNAGKPEIMWFSTTTNLRRLIVDDKRITIDSTVIEPSTVVHDLGVYSDVELSMCENVIRVARTYFYHQRRLCSIRRLLGQDVAAQLVSVLVLTRIDYCNEVLADLPSVALRLLQRVLDKATRLVLDLSSRDHVTPALLQLHWLPIKYRVRYKLCLLVHQAINGSAPPYLANMLTTVASVSLRASLRSASREELLSPATRLELSHRAFSVSGPPIIQRSQVLYQYCCF
jgi:hypothetical protein